MSRRAVFLDKDGTLIDDVPYSVDPERIRLAPGAAEGLPMLHAAGYRLVVVSNQSGVARGYFPESALAGVEDRLRRLLGDLGVPLAGFYYCPHFPDGREPEYARSCDCRKPEPGLILRDSAEQGLDPALSWMVGDKADDVEAGRRAGCATILIGTDGLSPSPGCRPDHIALDLAQVARLILDEDRGAARDALASPDETPIPMPDGLWFPPPLWGRVRVGGRDGDSPSTQSVPPPATRHPPPTQGGREEDGAAAAGT